MNEPERYCVACGTQLPSDALFCHRCGKAQPGTGRTPERAVRYETCEIRHIVIRGRGIGWFAEEHSHFDVEGVGPQGNYRVVLSEPLTGNPININMDRRIVAEYDRIVALLTADGWDPVGRATSWKFSMRFRRAVREPSA